MSDIPADYAERLNLREQIARIDRMLDEGAKLRAETGKLAAGQHKLASEAAKLDRDRSLSPWLAFGAMAGGVVTVATLLLRAIGVLS